jgi:hypothetical protein
LPRQVMPAMQALPRYQALGKMLGFQGFWHVGQKNVER